MVDEKDRHLKPNGVKGLGAMYHATGVRVRDLPIALDKIIMNDDQ